MHWTVAIVTLVSLTTACGPTSPQSQDTNTNQQSGTVRQLTVTCTPAVIYATKSSTCSATALWDGGNTTPETGNCAWRSDLGQISDSGIYQGPGTAAISKSPTTDTVECEIGTDITSQASLEITVTAPHISNLDAGCGDDGECNFQTLHKGSFIYSGMVTSNMGQVLYESAPGVPGAITGISLASDGGGEFYYLSSSLAFRPETVKITLEGPAGTTSASVTNTIVFE